MTGAILLNDNASFQMDATPDGMADDKFNGITIKGQTFGETVAAFELIKILSDGKWDKADASVGSGLYPAQAIAVNGGNDTDPAVMMVFGVVRNESWTGLTVGVGVYLSETTGAITQDAPSDPGDCVQLVGVAISDSEIYFNFNAVWLVVSP